MNSHPVASAALPPGFWGALALIAGGAVLVAEAPRSGAALLGAGALLFAVIAWRSNRRAGKLEAGLAGADEACRRLTAELAEARERPEQILQYASDAMFFIDPHDGTLLEVNRRAEELLGYSCGDIRHLTLGVLFPGRHRRRYLKLVRRVLKDGAGEEADLVFRRKDGSTFHGAVQARLGWLGRQRVAHGSLRDITPSVHLTTELRRHNQQLTLLNEIAQRVTQGRELSSIFAAILDQVVGSLAVSGGGLFLLRHRGTEMALGHHRGIPAEVVAELDALNLGEGLIGRVAVSGQPRLSVDLQKDHRRDSAAMARDGWRAFIAVPLAAEEQCLGVLFVFDRGLRVLNRNDLRLLQAIGRQIGPLLKNAELFDELQWQHRINQASLRELERSRAALRDHLAELEKSHRMLQSLDQMKSTFLALASHELRTPLTSICSGTELLAAAGECLDDAGRCALEAIVHGSRRLRDLVDDLLEAARLEANAIYLAREPFDPRPLLEDLVAGVQAVCDQRRLSCTLTDLPPAVTLRGDLHHLQRALGRLLENAVKFTSEGGWVQLGATIRRRDEVASRAGELARFSRDFFSGPHAGRYLEICIRDSGIGLLPGEEERIFDKFYAGGDISAHSSTSDCFGGKGVGLGLTLARGVVAAHAGLLWAESAGAGAGSSFFLLLPLDDAEPGFAGD